MREDRNTFVITLEEDVAEFLNIKNKSASELNGYINQLLHAEKQRQARTAQNRQQAEAQSGAENWMI